METHQVPFSWNLYSCHSQYTLKRRQNFHPSIHPTKICWGPTLYPTLYGLPPGISDGKESACNAGDLGSIPGLGRSPGEGNGNPFQYSFLENSMDRGAWQAPVHGVTKSQTRLKGQHFHFLHCIWPRACVISELQSLFYFLLMISHRMLTLSCILKNCNSSCVQLHLSWERISLLSDHHYNPFQSL